MVKNLSWEELQKPLKGPHWWYWILTGTKYSFPFIEISVNRFKNEYFCVDRNHLEYCGLNITKERAEHIGFIKCDAKEFSLNSFQYPNAYKIKTTKYLQDNGLKIYWKTEKNIPKAKQVNIECKLLNRFSALNQLLDGIKKLPKYTDKKGNVIGKETYRRYSLKQVINSLKYILFGI